MYGKTYDRLDYYKCEIQDDADDKGPVDVFYIYRMVVVAKAMAVAVIMPIMTVAMVVTMVMTLMGLVGLVAVAVIMRVCLCHVSCEANTSVWHKHLRNLQP